MGKGHAVLGIFPRHPFFRQSLSGAMGMAGQFLRMMTRRQLLSALSVSMEKGNANMIMSVSA